MATPKKKKKVCRHLEREQAERLARMMIEQGRNKIHHGVNRNKRVVAPAGAVTLF